MLLPSFAAADGETTHGDVARYRKLLARHPFFGKVAYRIVDEPPYLFIVQNPPRPNPRYAAERAAAYRKLLDPVLERFEEEVAAPLELAPRSDFLPVCILASTGDYDNYRRVTRGDWHFDVRSEVDRQLRAAVVHETPLGGANRNLHERSVRHAFVHVLQEAHHAVGGAPLSDWTYEGMAVRLSAMAAPDWEQRRALAVEVHRLVESSSDPKKRTAHLRTIEELDIVRKPENLSGFLSRRKGLQLPQEELWEAWASFHCQAFLMTSFLLEAGDGAYVDRYHGILTRELQGKGGAGVLGKVMDDSERTRIDREFRRWLIDEHRAAWPEDHVEVGDLLPATAPGEVAAEEAVAVPRIRWSEATLRDTLAWALHRARSGDLAGALDVLERGRNRAGDKPTRARTERERARIAAWQGARRAYLEELERKEGRLSVRRDGEVVRAKLAKLEGNLATLVARNASWDVTLDELDDLALARKMKSSLAADEQWVRIFVYALHGDSKWRTLARGLGQAGAELESDAPDYDELLAHGEAVAHLDTFREWSPPETPSQAEANLDILAALLARPDDERLFAENRAALRDLRTREAAELFELSDPWSHLEARTTPLEGNKRLRVEYDFERPEELSDFQRDPEYLARWAKRFEELEGAARPFEIAEGRLVGSGVDLLRLPVDLRAPLNIRYTLAVASGGSNRFWAGIGLCDDLQGNFSLKVNYDSLFSIEPTGERSNHNDEVVYFLEEAREVVLKHDGTAFKSFLDGEPVVDLVKMRRNAGSLFLWVCSEPEIYIDELSIEGELMPGSFNRFKKTWIGRRINE